MALLSYLQIFLSMFTCTILYFLPGVVTYKMMAVIIAVISTIALILSINHVKKNAKPLIVILLLCLTVTYLYYTTSLIYGKHNIIYNSFLLVIAGQISPTMLCAVVVSRMKRTQLQIKQSAPLVGLLFTIIAFIAAFFPDSATTGGFVATENGLNYQSASYLAAYAAAFNYYFVIFQKHLPWPMSLNITKYKYVFLVLIILNLLTIFIAGGRGGLVLFIIQSLYAYRVYTKTNHIRMLSGHFIIIMILVLFIGILAVSFASTYGGSTSGFSRIVDTVQNHDENGRDIMRNLAFSLFLDSPIWGHGIGSVFYELGIYSHNYFTDIIIEIGIIGLIFFVTIIIATWHRSERLFRLDPTNSIWQLIFIDGFVLSLFSGYYLGQLPIYWSMAFILSYSIKNHKYKTSYFSL